MNARTERQIEAMKRTQFGVEIEMNGITRERAARVAAEFFGTNRWEKTAARNGYSTVSAFDNEGREWKFSKDVSITGLDAEKTELISPLLTWEHDMESLQELVRRLRRAGGVSKPSVGASVHVHGSGEGHTPESLRALVNLMASHEGLIFEALRIDQARIDRYCKPVNHEFLRVLNEKKPKTMAKLADIWYSTQDADWGRTNHYNSSRYSAANLHSFFTGKGIELRLFNFNEAHDGKKGGLNAGELKTFIQLSLGISQMAKEIKTASPNPSTSPNKKFTMRTWLNRMGFIGDEFATAREVLTRWLPGDAAFRNGRQSA